MIDNIELLSQLTKVGKFYCPIITGRNQPVITVSIPDSGPIPDGWEKAAEVPGYYPDGTKRIKLSYRR